MKTNFKIFDMQGTAFDFKQTGFYIYSFEQFGILLLIVIVLINFIHVLEQINAYG